MILVLLLSYDFVKHTGFLCLHVNKSSITVFKCQCQLLLLFVKLLLHLLKIPTRSHDVWVWHGMSNGAYDGLRNTCLQHQSVPERNRTRTDYFAGHCSVGVGVCAYASHSRSLAHARASHSPRLCHFPIFSSYYISLFRFFAYCVCSTSTSET